MDARYDRIFRFGVGTQAKFGGPTPIYLIDFLVWGRHPLKICGNPREPRPRIFFRFSPLPTGRARRLGSELGTRSFGHGHKRTPAAQGGQERRALEGRERLLGLVWGVLGGGLGLGWGSGCSLLAVGTLFCVWGTKGDPFWLHEFEPTPVWFEKGDKHAKQNTGNRCNRRKAASSG